MSEEPINDEIMWVKDGVVNVANAHKFFDGMKFEVVSPEGIVRGWVEVAMSACARHNSTAFPIIGTIPAGTTCGDFIRTI